MSYSAALKREDKNEKVEGRICLVPGEMLFKSSRLLLEVA
jgi:hypothetical protein